MDTEYLDDPLQKLNSKWSILEDGVCTVSSKDAGGTLAAITQA